MLFPKLQHMNILTGFSRSFSLYFQTTDWSSRRKVGLFTQLYASLLLERFCNGITGVIILGLALNEYDMTPSWRQLLPAIYIINITVNSDVFTLSKTLVCGMINDWLLNGHIVCSRRLKSNPGPLGDWFDIQVFKVLRVTIDFTNYSN